MMTGLVTKEAVIMILEWQWGHHVQELVQEDLEPGVMVHDQLLVVSELV
jgi:hypothetical protein